MRLHLQATALTIALFTISITSLPTFSATRSALTSLLTLSKRAPQPPFEMDPWDDDDWNAAIQAWDQPDLDISDTPISDAIIANGGPAGAA